MNVGQYGIRSKEMKDIVGCNHPVVCPVSGRVILDQVNGYSVPPEPSLQNLPSYREKVSQYRD